MKLRWLMALLVCGALIVSACADDDTAGDGSPPGTEAPGDTAPPGDEPDETEAAHPYGDHTSDDYSDDETWLCRPGHDEICTEDMDVQVIDSDGNSELLEFEAVEDAPVDCFYVYPTVSADPETNSDLVPGPSEITTVRTQAAHLGSECRVFAPMYRQVTLTALFAALDEGETPFSDDAADIAYESLLDAWKHYIANDNEGRGVVLVGHSQGAGVLTQLIIDEIEGDADLADRLVAAYVLGSAAQEPVDDGAEGSFAELEACQTPEDTGCIVSWSSYRNTSPPPDDAIFARGEDRTRAMCTNPGALDGGIALLTPYFSTGEVGVAGVPTSGADTDWVDPDSGIELTAPWVALPDLVEGQCVEDGEFHYLEITLAGEDGPRSNEFSEGLTPEWGLHLLDTNLPMGQMIELVRSQIESYTGN